MTVPSRLLGNHCSQGHTHERRRSLSDTITHCSRNTTGFFFIFCPKRDSGWPHCTQSHLLLRSLPHRSSISVLEVRIQLHHNINASIRYSVYFVIGRSLKVDVWLYYTLTNSPGSGDQLCCFFSLSNRVPVI